MAEAPAREEGLPADEDGPAEAGEHKGGHHLGAAPGQRLRAALLDGEDEEARAAEEGGAAEQVDARKGPPREQMGHVLVRPQVGDGQDGHQAARDVHVEEPPPVRELRDDAPQERPEHKGHGQRRADDGADEDRPMRGPDLDEPDLRERVEP